jgi:hypothetical protein
MDDAELGNRHHDLYAVNGRFLIIAVDPDGGWEIYIPATADNSITASLKAAELACGIQSDDVS